MRLTIRSKRNIKNIFSRSFMYLGIVFFILWSMFPICWVFLTSMKIDKEVYALPPTVFPTQWTFMQYIGALFDTPLLRFLFNSFIISITVTIITILFTSLAAYAVVRMRFKGRKILARGIVAAYLVPPTLLFIPLYKVIQNLGLLNTYLSLVMSYLTIAVPFSTWMLIGYFRTIPVEIEDAARVDGCNRLQTIFKITLPMALPGLVVVTLYTFTQAWNQYLYPLVFVSSKSVIPVTAGLSYLIRGDTYQWGRLMAYSVISMVPIFILYSFLQKFVIGGLKMGGVKQ